MIAGLALCLALSGLRAGPAWAGSASPGVEGAGLSLTPDPAVIHGCETVAVQVWVHDVSGLYGADIQVAFDANVLEVVDADPARPGVQVQDGSFLSPDFVVSREADNTAGILQYTISQVAPALPVSGSGVLFTILFRAKSAGPASALAFTQTDLVDLDGGWIAVQRADGNASVSAPAAPTLGISRLSSVNARLSWTAAVGAANYLLHRGTLPYFGPSDPAYLVTGSLSYDDVGVLGNPAANFCYVVESACASGLVSEPSNRVGEFEFALAPGGL